MEEARAMTTQAMITHPVGIAMEEDKATIIRPVVVDMEETTTEALDNRDRVRDRIRAPLDMEILLQEANRVVLRESLSAVGFRLLRASLRRRDGKQFKSVVMILSIDGM